VAQTAEKVGTAELVEDFAGLRRAVSRFGSGRALVDYETAAQVLRQPDIVVLRWPLELTRLAAARVDRAPRLLVVEGDDEPPAEWDPLEDWVRLPADARDVQVRVAALGRRALSSGCRPSVDGFDRLIYDGRWVSLSPNDYRLIEPLVEHFDDVVPYEEVAALLTNGNVAAGSAGRVRLTRLRRRIAPLGLEIRTVRPHGLALTARRDAS
jgi:DNA-binding response OmpR family regulator